MTGSKESTSGAGGGAGRSGGVRGIPPSVNAWQGEFLEREYARYKAEPSSLTPEMAAFFGGFDLALGGAPMSAGSKEVSSVAASPVDTRVANLVNAYREFGHQGAKNNPLGFEPPRPRVLSLAHHGLTEADLEASAPAGLLDKPGSRVRDVVEHFERTYCGTIGAEFMHLQVQEEREWFLAQFERSPTLRAFDNESRLGILRDLTTAEAFDKFLGRRYQGKKRFALEGGESMIPALQAMFRRASDMGVEDLVLGMSHRGRQTVLRMCLGKDLKQLFSEFEDSWCDVGTYTGGDVKYHGGFAADVDMGNGRTMHLSMLNNPSHLEAVNPVVMGRCRARQDRMGDVERRRAISLLIHGDAAVAGQGVVIECLTMSQLDGYTVGGTLHIVVNNQVGFTTLPKDGRSSMYCTDVAKSIAAPVLHVNADDPEAAIFAGRLAVEYRHKFRKDVFIDLVCFRRHGHNEQDEPTFTQPAMYARVKAHPGPAELYRRKLIEEGLIGEDAARAMLEGDQRELDEAQAAAQKSPVNPVSPPGEGDWKGFQAKYSFDSPRTGVKAETLAEVSAALGRTPEGFTVHSKLKALLQARAAVPQSGKISHADGEQLAFGSLLVEGVGVRLSGQDVRRGTFSHRHSVLFDERTGDAYTPVNHIRRGKQAELCAWNSPLSEYGVMGFDYGYSCGAPRTLVIWEAQFGDFFNGAQIIIDQFLSSSELKWTRWTGLVLLLPHGAEGQGPEHSSARPERFLQMCAGENMEVACPTTGAQMFHLLRRQALRDFRKPLIVLTPKRFLRLETSTLDELVGGGFQHVLDDPTIKKGEHKGVRRVIYCTGKVYHELQEKRAAGARGDVAIVRIEQLYPFNAPLAREIDARYPSGAARVWMQEEPRNQGAFSYISEVFRDQLGIHLGYLGRAASASPATGSEHAHKEQQERLLTDALQVGAGAAQGTNGSGNHGGSRGAARDTQPMKARN